MYKSFPRQIRTPFSCALAVIDLCQMKIWRRRSKCNSWTKVYTIHQNITELIMPTMRALRWNPILLALPVLRTENTRQILLPEVPLLEDVHQLY
jgi:hypothetical protein